MQHEQRISSVFRICKIDVVMKIKINKSKRRNKRLYFYLYLNIVAITLYLL